jgi:hypothetical protein
MKNQPSTRCAQGKATTVIKHESSNPMPWTHKLRDGGRESPGGLGRVEMDSTERLPWVFVRRGRGGGAAGYFWSNVVMALPMASPTSM